MKCSIVVEVPSPGAANPEQFLVALESKSRVKRRGGKLEELWGGREDGRDTFLELKGGGWITNKRLLLNLFFV